MGGKLDTASLSPADGGKLCWGKGEGKGYAFRGTGDADSCPTFIFKSEPPVGVAQTITRLEGSSEAGTAKHAVGGESVERRSE